MKNNRKMSVKRKEKLLDKFINEKVEEFQLYDWGFYYVDSPRDSYAYIIPVLQKIYIQNESIRNYSIEVLKDMVLHEIAHIFAGINAKHGYEFRKACKQIGCRCNRAYNDYEFFDKYGKYPYEFKIRGECIPIPDLFC